MPAARKPARNPTRKSSGVSKTRRGHPNPQNLGAFFSELLQPRPYIGPELEREDFDQSIAGMVSGIKEFSKGATELININDKTLELNFAAALAVTWVEHHPILIQSTHVSSDFSSGQRQNMEDVWAETQGVDTNSSELLKVEQKLRRLIDASVANTRTLSQELEITGTSEEKIVTLTASVQEL
jgi:hypothetical protein